MESTVSQLLNSMQKDSPFSKAKTSPETIRQLLQEAQKDIKAMQWQNADPIATVALAKWLVYQQVSNQIHTPNYNITRISTYSILYNNRDYLAYLLSARPNDAKSKFNTPGYTYLTLQQESEDWHEQLKLNARSQGRVGREIPLAGMPPGWKWVSLDRSYCREEAGAMGHCGNSGGREGDNIYSLRDANNKPHLTFIVNDHKLGESKGFGNSKPSPKYHPMIVAFLTGKDRKRDIVDFIVGGGYLPSHNFQFNDLSPELKQAVLEKKPFINDPVGSVVSRYKSPYYLRKKLNSIFDFEFDAIIPQSKTVILKKWDDITHMIDWLKHETRSQLKEVPDLEDLTFDGYYPETDTAVNSFEQNADEKNEKLMEEILKILKRENKDEHGEEIEDADIAWACEIDDDLDTALRSAYSDADQIGSEGEAWKHVNNHFDNEEDDNKNGFYLHKRESGAWDLQISFEDLNKLFNTNEALTDLIEFSYSQPYYGYSGWDEEVYNERLGELLSEILDRLKKE